MSYETVLEEIDVTHGGKTVTFEVCSEPGKPQRVFVQGSTLYYDIPVFNAGLKNAENIVRRQVANLFEHEASEVRGPL